MWLQRADGVSRNSGRLVESAVMLLGAIERNGNDDDFTARSSARFRNDSAQNLRQLHAQRLRSATHALIFQKMDEVAQHAFIRTISRCTNVAGTEPLAQSAEL